MENSKDKISEKEHRDKKIKIVIADDHPLVRKALRDSFQTQNDFEVVAEASNGEQAVQLASEHIPDIIIMDINLPRLNGIEATRLIKAKHPAIAILALTVYDDNEHILGMLEAGAAGYLTKTVFGEDVARAVRGIIAGDTIISGTLSQHLIQNVAKQKASPVSLPSGERLTRREMEVLKLIAKGMTNKDIAKKLGVTDGTVKGYIVEIFAKLNVFSRTEALATSIKAGIISIEDLA
ncbi:MAG: response regulator transcription factor [Dehalococcoidales bacterium]|nr:response regulator transcription factor [Dehalococcoidales bacterium]